MQIMRPFVLAATISVGLPNFQQVAGPCASSVTALWNVWRRQRRSGVKMRRLRPKMGSAGPRWQLGWHSAGRQAPHEKSS